MIKLNGIYKKYHSGSSSVSALQNINLHVPAGKIMGIIGASGAGKSTLIRMVNLLERPDQGSVLVDGMNLMYLNREELAEARRKMGMIFQQFHLLSSRTVFGNIALPLELTGHSKKEINQMLQVDPGQYQFLVYALDNACYTIDQPKGKDLSEFTEISLDVKSPLNFLDLGLEIKDQNQYFIIKGTNKLLVVKSNWVINHELKSKK